MRVVLGVWLVAAAVGTSSLVAATRDVDIVAGDGAKLRASYFAAAKRGPAVILLHMCGGDGGNRKGWIPLAERLAGAGVHVLTLDFRGFGESGLGPGAASREDHEQNRWPGDVEAALAYLVAQPGVDGAYLGAAGASCGCAQAITLARHHPEVRALVLLSGGTDEAGRQFLAGTAGIPVLAAASRDDRDLVDYLAWLVGFSSNPESVLIAFENAGHGTDMFAVAKELEPRVTDWFTRYLRPDAHAIASVRRADKAAATAEFWSVLTLPDGAGRAMAMLESARHRVPDAVLFPEMAGQMLASEREEGGKPKEAIEILKVTLAAYPRSPWVYSSLARACEAAGEKGEAIGWAEKGLQVLGETKTISEELRSYFAQRLNERIKRLSGSAQVAPQSVLDELDVTTYEVVYTVPEMSQVRVVKDIVFKGSGEAGLTADLYLPPANRAATPLPVVIFVNGVAVRNFKEWGQYRSWPRLVAATGLAAVSYRTLDSRSAAADLGDLIGFLRGIATEHALDVDRLALWACSANVRTALPFAMEAGRPWLRAAVMYYGSGEAPSIRADLPLLFVRSGRDNQQLNQAISALGARALEANAPWTVVNAASSPHAFDVITDTAEARETIQRTLDFLVAHLRGSDHVPAPVSPARSALIHQFASETASALTEFEALAARYPSTARLWSTLARLQLAAGRNAEAAGSYEKAIALGESGAASLYNLACAYALIGEKDWALEALGRALKAGFADRDRMATDGDLASIRDDPRFQSLLKQ